MLVSSSLCLARFEFEDNQYEKPEMVTTPTQSHIQFTEPTLEIENFAIQLLLPY